jgi:hypothetical protein
LAAIAAEHVDLHHKTNNQGYVEDSYIVDLKHKEGCAGDGE